MDFAQLLTQLMLFLYNNLILPIDNVLNEIGFDIVALHDINFNIGFGQVTWFSLNLRDIIIVVIGFVVSITALVLTWRFIRFLNGFLKSLFTGIKR